MAYVYSAVNRLAGKPIVGNGSCVLMVQFFGKLPKQNLWRQGQRVVEQTNIWPGTATATFENGVYPNLPTGNHDSQWGKRWADPSNNADAFYIIE